MPSPLDALGTLPDLESALGHFEISMKLPSKYARLILPVDQLLAALEAAETEDDVWRVDHTVKLMQASWSALSEAQRSALGIPYFSHNAIATVEHRLAEHPMLPDERLGAMLQDRVLGTYAIHNPALLFRMVGNLSYALHRGLVSCALNELASEVEAHVPEHESIARLRALVAWLQQEDRFTSYPSTEQDGPVDLLLVDQVMILIDDLAQKPAPIPMGPELSNYLLDVVDRMDVYDEDEEFVPDLARLTRQIGLVRAVATQLSDAPDAPLSWNMPTVNLVGGV